MTTQARARIPHVRTGMVTWGTEDVDVQDTGARADTELATGGTAEHVSSRSDAPPKRKRKRRGGRTRAAQGRWKVAVFDAARAATCGGASSTPGVATESTWQSASGGARGRGTERGEWWHWLRWGGTLASRAVARFLPVLSYCLG